MKYTGEKKKKANAAYDIINVVDALIESYYSVMTGLINRNVGCDNALDELAPAYLVIFLGSRNMIITPGGNQRCPVQGVPLIETVQPLTGSINQLEILSKRWPTTLARCNLSLIHI